jgi:hypothetical protein
LLLDIADQVKRGHLSVKKIECHVDTHQYGRRYVEFYAEPTPKGLRSQRRKKPHGTK